MALRQLRTAETMYISDDLTDGVAYPPSSEAVHDHVGEIVFEKILMAANDKTYEVTIDSDGALAVAEVTEGE